MGGFWIKHLPSETTWHAGRCRPCNINIKCKEIRGTRQRGLERTLQATVSDEALYLTGIRLLIGETLGVRRSKLWPAELA